MMGPSHIIHEQSITSVVLGVEHKKVSVIGLVLVQAQFQFSVAFNSVVPSVLQQFLLAAIKQIPSQEVFKVNSVDVVNLTTFSFEKKLRFQVSDDHFIKQHFQVDLISVKILFFFSLAAFFCNQFGVRTMDGFQLVDVSINIENP